MRTLAIAVAASALALSGCATTGQISTDYDQAQNFSEYSTFSWAGIRPMLAFGNRMVPTTVQASIAEAIIADLSAKGYTFTDDMENADFAVSFTVGTRDNVEFREAIDPFWNNRMNWRWGGPFWPSIATPSISRMQYREYTEGTLSIDIYDVERRAPVWHGAGTRDLTRSELRGETNTAGEATRQILAGFPPG
ncbi:DUF4136 domain-containing protein [Qipengyuania flava]|uniref:DUF4136 domain-containing protein n=1 Tax=Qipengyuania flava TaxID=192812 RepID=UPI001C62C14B|nr:DUF4136 domain-containing protein [Qipengyuania flava]QYJ08335.1 DUF4136 domain-containing protein [Qipengyuania flava]